MHLSPRDIFVEFQTNLIFLNRFPRNIQILIFKKIRRVESELLQSERQMWRGTYWYFVILEHAYISNYVSQRQIGVRECLLSFGVECFFFRFAIQKFKN
jgi:hypothetical protein